MASSKSLIRAGASMATRFLGRPFHNTPIHLLSPKHELIAAPPKMPPLLFVPQSQKMAPFYSPPQPQNEVEFLINLSSEGFLYPSGLPSLPLLLPEGICLSCFRLALEISPSEYVCSYDFEGPNAC
ncbi:hypothetical protein SASPL_123235 [Salvia splendens]|uniref:Uncharacterized protein n=1 Tax=Salvia splendens TaxID=180675 RepID=A0A8X8XQT1_SALSN|nr:hypothetical protein SASPL_123235 [Salvia splendens]